MLPSFNLIHQKIYKQTGQQSFPSQMTHHCAIITFLSPEVPRKSLTRMKSVSRHVQHHESWVLLGRESLSTPPFASYVKSVPKQHSIPECLEQVANSRHLGSVALARHGPKYYQSCRKGGSTRRSKRCTRRSPVTLVTQCEARFIKVGCGDTGDWICEPWRGKRNLG